VIVFDAATSSVQLVCSLDPFIPLSTKIMWLDRRITRFVQTPPNILETNDTTTVITIVDLQSLDEGCYQCVFSDTGLFLSRIITLG